MSSWISEILCRVLLIIIWIIRSSVHTTSVILSLGNIYPHTKHSRQMPIKYCISCLQLVICPHSPPAYNVRFTLILPSSLGYTPTLCNIFVRSILAFGIWAFAMEMSASREETLPLLTSLLDMITDNPESLRQIQKIKNSLAG